MTCDTLAEERTCQPRRTCGGGDGKAVTSFLLIATQSAVPFLARTIHLRPRNGFVFYSRIPEPHRPSRGPEVVSVLYDYDCQRNAADPFVDMKKNDLLSNVITHHRSQVCDFPPRTAHTFVYFFPNQSTQPDEG